jgi:hypothetical protein
VYFNESVQYWRGRFSTLLDRLRGDDYSITSAHFSSVSGSKVKSSVRPKIDDSSFEIDESRRIRMALLELRSCCRTADAVRSFETFEKQIRARYKLESLAAKQTTFYTHSAESKGRLLAAGFRPKVLGIDSNIAAATMKLVSSEAKQKPSMIRSKTMGDIAPSKKQIASGTSPRDPAAACRRPSYLKVQEEVLTHDLTLTPERRARAIAAAQRNAMRSGIHPATSGLTAQGKMLRPTPQQQALRRPSAQRKSSAASSAGGTGTNAEMLKRVFSESVRSVRRMGRSFTGMSGSGDA